MNGNVRVGTPEERLQEPGVHGSSEGHKAYIQCPKPRTAGIPRNGLHQGQNKTQATE